MKVNYQRGENLKKKKKAGKLSIYMKSERDSYYYLKQIENRKFRAQTKDRIRNNKYELLPIHKKRIWWDC